MDRITARRYKPGMPDAPDPTALPPEEKLPPEKMTPEERQRAVEWGKSHPPKFVCSLCGMSNWSMDDQFVQLMPFRRDSGWVVGGRVYPLIQLICATPKCGHVMLINAIVAGILEAPKLKEGAEDGK
jgi:hypothetical protein